MTDKNIDINAIKQHLENSPQLPLKFHFEGTAIHPGYHVTEVKFATIKSIDCGKSSKPEFWNEITIQLLDGRPDASQDHMNASTFTAIIAKALGALKEDAASFLYFEFAPDNGPLLKLRAESVEHFKDEIVVSLGSEKALCKPFESSKLAQAATTLGVPAFDLATDTDCCSKGRRANIGNCCG